MSHCQKVKLFCKDNKINIIAAPVNDHREIGLVERLTPTIKRRLARTKPASKPNSFCSSIKAVAYQFRICKQKTTNYVIFNLFCTQTVKKYIKVCKSGLYTKQNYINFVY